MNSKIRFVLEQAIRDLEALRFYSRRDVNNRNVAVAAIIVFMAAEERPKILQEVL